MKLKKLSNKAIQFSEIPNIIMVFVLAAIFGSVGVLIIGNFKDNMTVADGNTTADYGIEGIKELLSWNQTLAVIFIAVILISAVMLFGRGRSV